jgi:hypothetical protein
LENQQPGGSWGSLVFDNVGDSPSTSYGLLALSRVAAAQCLPAIDRATDWLVRHQLPSGGWPDVPDLRQERSGHIGYTTFALRALAPVPKDARKANAIQNGVLYLLNSRNPDGGWGFSPTQLTDPCLTAYVISALLDLNFSWNISIPDDIIDAAKIALLREQSADGSWRDWQGVKASPEGTAFAIEALARLRDLSSSNAIDRGLHWLLSVRQANGSWTFDPANGGDGCVWVTHNAFLALLAVREGTQAPSEAPVRVTVSSPKLASSRGFSALARGIRAFPDQFALFLGAGAAMPQLPSGNQIGEQLAKTYFYSEDEPGDGTAQDEQSIRRRFEADFHTPLRLETVIVQLKDRFGQGQTLTGILEELLGTGRPMPASYGLLAELLHDSAIPAVILTTNFDEKLEAALRMYYPDDAVDRMLVIEPEDWRRCNLSESAYHPLIVKLHGSYSRPATLAATMNQIQHLDAHKDEVLRSCLDTRHVIFVGYSFQDPDISEVLMQSIASGRAEGLKAWWIDPAPSTRMAFALELLRCPEDHLIEATFEDFLRSIKALRS